VIEKFFFINSLNIKSSLDKFDSLSKTEQSRYKVIAGHGASLFSGFVENPFTITILREPVDLFISQYRFLKISPNSLYFDEVSKLERIEDYLDFALKMGQDNLLTRFLSDSIQFLINPEIPIPNMDIAGNRLLDKALKNLQCYDTVMELNNFDSGVYALKTKLLWNQIPIYRPSNMNKKKGKKLELTGEFLNRLKHSLRFDISLYETFKQEWLDIAKIIPENSIQYWIFKQRQFALNSVAKLLGKT